MNNKYEMFRKELSNNVDIEELLKKYTFQEIMQYYEKIINEDYDNFVSNRQKTSKRRCLCLWII